MGSQRVCFVVSDLLGLVTNSGIGTATSYGSLALASAGYEVTLVYTRDGLTLDSAWTERYRSAGVTVEAVPPMIVAPGHLSDTYRAYKHLETRRFDAIVFQDWLALGWASMQAKHAGLAFAETQLVHVVHGPDAWLHEANLQTGLTVEDVALADAGKVSAELADTVVGPSRYLIDWMVSAGWHLPARRFVVPYFTEAQARVASGEPEPLERQRSEVPVREIAFFGRLERRKGVQVFAEAVSRVDPALLRGVTISFLGREATYRKHDVVAMLDGAVRRSVAGIEFHTGLDNEQACSHLAEPGTVAVIASLVDNSPNTIYECIEHGIPFLATSTGGNSELIHPDDRERTLVAPAPTAMATALTHLLQSPRVPDPVRPAFDLQTSLRRWEEVFCWRPTAPLQVRQRPPVTVVVVHHDRPALASTAIEAVDAQDYEDLEIVVVDDGSERPESEQALRHIEGRQWRHELRVLREPNRYLGAARNAGARAGRGELLVFVDDDDVPVSTFASTLVTAIEATGADAVTCAMTSFAKPLGPPESADSRGTWVFAGGPLHLAAVVNCLGGAPVMIRRSVFESMGGYHECHGLGYEDWHLYVRLLFAGHKVFAVPEPLYWYRLQAQSMRHTMSDYKSIQVVLDEFRAAVHPALRPLLDLAYGQGVVLRERTQHLLHELDLRERVLWMAEERLQRLPPAPSASIHAEIDASVTNGPGANPDGRTVAESVRRSLDVGRRRLRRVAAALASASRR
ncbi:MAG: glycosyltransferase [Acidimicrobiales bacterium]